MLNKAYPPWIGGIERYVRDISEALAGRGWKITVLVCNDARFETREKIHGVDIIRVPRWGTLLSQPIPSKFFRRLNSLPMDLLHVHVPFPLAWLAVRKIDKSVPVVCTWHSDIVRQRSLMRFLSPLERNFISRCSRILPTSYEFMKNSSALKHFRNKCTVIPLAIPPNIAQSQRIAPTLCSQIKKRFGNRLLLFVGRLVGYKGLNYLIDAMSSIDAPLIIAGDGPDRQQLEHKAARSPASSKIYFVGQVSESEKQALYCAADLLILPSISQNEAFGYVLLEAMAQGCPVISTDLPTGVRWVNQHEETGLVVPPGDANALAGAINRLLNDRLLLQKLSEGARQRVKEYFHFDDLIENIESVYINLLK